MRDIDKIPTPAALVDLDVLERNVSRMAQRCREAGVQLRPHAKTHKSLDIAQLQGREAVGLTVAKVSEAEVFVAGGVHDIFVAYPVVGEARARRLVALHERARIAVGVDSVAGARTLGPSFREAGRVLDIMLELDTGLHRTGVLPVAALGVAQAVAEVPGLRLRGVFTHAGHVYGARTPEERATIAYEESAQAVEVAQRLRNVGLECPEVSVGSTPTVTRGSLAHGVTEARPGNYVFHDASQVNLGVCDIEDCALTVAATVVSVPAPDRAVLDAGSKALSKDPLAPDGGGYGWLLGRRSRIVALTEEHGVVGVEEGESFAVGERVRILPNHCCVVVNLFDRLMGLRGHRFETEIAVDARGCSW